MNRRDLLFAGGGLAVGTRAWTLYGVDLPTPINTGEGVDVTGSEVLEMDIVDRDNDGDVKGYVSIENGSDQKYRYGVRLAAVTDEHGRVGAETIGFITISPTDTERIMGWIYDVGIPTAEVDGVEITHLWIEETEVIGSHTVTLVDVSVGPLPESAEGMHNEEIDLE